MQIFIVLFLVLLQTCVLEATSFPTLIAQLEAHNPDLQAARQAWLVQKANLEGAQAWPSTKLSYSQETSPTFPGIPADKTTYYRIEQDIPFPGKLWQEAQMKHHEVAIAESNYHEKYLTLIGSLRTLYYRLYLVDEKLRLAQESVDVMRSVLQTAQARLSANQTSTSDVYMAQMELRRMENMLFEEQQERKLIQNDLNTLFQDPPEKEWDKVDAPELRDIPHTLDQLQALAAQYSPKSRMAMLEKHHSQALLKRQRLSYLPDFGLLLEKQTGGSGKESGDQIGFSMYVPFWATRPIGLYEAAKAHIQESDADAQAMIAMTRRMVFMEQTETITHLTLARNDKAGLLPAALANLKTAREHYASGRLDILHLLEALRNWIQATTEYHSEVYHYGEHWSELERWVGVSLEEKP